MSNEVKSELLNEMLSPFPTRSEQLVLRAEGFYRLGGEDKLDADERRDALQYLMMVRRDLNNYELARIFKVSEKTIRDDKVIIRKRVSEDISDQDIAVVVSDLRKGHDWLMTELARSTKKCTLGSPTYLNHLKAYEDFSFRIVEVLQSLGVYPKNLGNLTKTEFVYKAHVAKGGGVNTTIINSKEELRTIEAQEVKLLPGAFETDADREARESLAAEFADTAIAEQEVPEKQSGPTRMQRA